MVDLGELQRSFTNASKLLDKNKKRRDSLRSQYEKARDLVNINQHNVDTLRDQVRDCAHDVTAKD